MPHHFRHRDLGEDRGRGDGNARYRRKNRIGANGRDAKAAFDDALHNFVIAVANDVEHYHSDESIDETMEANEWSFTEDGKFYPLWRKS